MRSPQQRGAAIIVALALSTSASLVGGTASTAVTPPQIGPSALVKPSKAGAVRYVEPTDAFGGKTGRVVQANRVMQFGRPPGANTPLSGQAVILQFTVANAKRAGTIKIWPVSEKRPKTPIIVFAKGNSSTSGLVRVGPEHRFKFVSSTKVNLRIVVFGWLTGPAKAQPGPGGTQVIPALSLLDATAKGPDRIRSGAACTTVQATGKGGIPRNGVRAVRLQVQAVSKKGATLYLDTPNHEWEEVRTAVDDHWTTKQILARVDQDGRLCYRLSGASKPQVRLVIIGWVAESKASDTVSTMTGGIAPVEARVVTAKSVKVPAKYKGKYRVLMISLATTTAVPDHAPDVLIRSTIKTKQGGYFQFGKSLKSVLKAKIHRGQLAAKTEAQIIGLAPVSKQRKTYLAIPKGAKVSDLGLEGYAVKPLALPSAPTGSVWAWGDNDHGALGTKSNSLQGLVPAKVPGLRGVVAIAAGYSGGRALDSSGAVWSWGWNGSGQLGDGTTYSSATPVRAKGLPPAKAIAAGAASTYAVARDGTVWAWGSNAAGRLGNGTTVNSLTPIQIKNLTKITAVAVDDDTAYALDSDGRVWAWGDNTNGELGRGSGQNSSAPIQVPGLRRVVAIEAGPQNGYALNADGDVYAWGANWYNQITAASTSQDFAATRVNGLPKLASISAYAEGAFAVSRDGTVWGWGGHDTPKAPWQVPNVGDIVQVSPYSTDLVYAVQSDGSLWAWGENTYGQIGDGTTNFAQVPRRVIGLKNVTAVANQLGVGAYALTR